ncbi:MAG: hypothetical protein AB1611_18575 [bacterium]
MDWYYHFTTISKEKSQIEISAPGSLIVFLTCLIAISSSGCAAGRQVFSLSSPLPVAEQDGIHREIEAEGSEQPGSGLGKTASATCRMLAVPFLVAGTAGLWYLERTGDEEDEHDNTDLHQRRELCLLSIGSFLVGSLLYYASQSFDDTAFFREPHQNLYCPLRPKGWTFDNKFLNTSTQE